MSRSNGKATLFEYVIAIYALSKIKPLIVKALGGDRKYKTLYTGDKASLINAYRNLSGSEKKMLERTISDEIESGGVSEIDIIRLKAQEKLDSFNVFD